MLSDRMQTSVPSRPRARRRGHGLLAGLLATAGLTLGAAPAHAAAKVTVDADGAGAVIDDTYSTTLSVSGRGFQSVKSGHGGVYVWFGTVNGTWQPSRGGTSGVNYVYVPDNETKDNSGFQKYVAFPGASTASAANGGAMSRAGTWSTELVVPGPTFEAVGRNGTVTTVDCRTVTCGVITIGAHGVHNPTNETFTPVELTDLEAAGQRPSPAAQKAAPTAGSSPAQASDGADRTQPGAVPQIGAAPAGPAAISVDHASATAGRVMSFEVTGLPPGAQFTVVLDDGLAAAGPFAAGDDGRAAGVLGLPADLGAGTHSLRLFGGAQDASAKFGVQAAVAEETGDEGAARWPSLAFAVFGGLVFVGAAALSVRRLLRGRRAAR